MNETSKGSLATTAVAAAAIGLCCGVPLLASLGLVGVVTGLSVGSWLVIALAAVLLLVAAVRRRRRSSPCTRPVTDEPCSTRTGRNNPPTDTIPRGTGHTTAHQRKESR